MRLKCANEKKPIHIYYSKSKFQKIRKRRINEVKNKVKQYKRSQKRFLIKVKKLSNSTT